MIRKCLKKAAALAAALMMALMFIPAGAYAVYAADVGNTVVVGVNADYGISAVGGNYTGYAFDFLREIQKRSDLTFTFVEGTAPELASKIAKGEVDVIPCVSSNELDAWQGMTSAAEPTAPLRLTLTNLPLTTKYTAIYIPADSDISFQDYEALKSSRIGYLKEDYSKYFINGAFIGADIRKAEFVGYDSESQMKNDFESGKIDAVAKDCYRIWGDELVACQVATEDCYFMTSSANETLISTLDTAVASVIMSDPEFTFDIYEKYVTKYGAQRYAFTEAEKHFIEKNPVITVAYNRQAAVIDRLESSTDSLSGPTDKLLKMISKATGLEIKVIGCDSLGDCVTALNNGSAQIICGGVNSNSMSKYQGLKISRPYTKVPIVAVGKAGSSVGAHSMIAIPAIGDDISKYISEIYPGAQILHFDTEQKCLDAVQNGEADVAFAGAYEMLYYLDRGYDGLDIIDVSPAIHAECLAFSSDMPELSKMFGKIISGMNSNSSGVYTYAYIVSGGSHSAANEFVEKYLVWIIAGILAILAAVFVIVCVSSFRSRRVADVDPLTGGRSRAKYFEDTKKLLKRSNPEGWAIALFDIDKFKYVNDRLGYEEGNRMLERLYKTISDHLDHDEVFARMADDNFVLTIHNATDIELNGRISEIFNEFMRRNSLFVKYPVVFSAGICRLNQCVHESKHGEVDINAAIDRCKIAKSTLKGTHFSSIAFYDGSIRDRALREKDYESIMPGALQRREFQCYLQPKYGLRSRNIEGAEALIRWNSPDFGFISPGDFIPIAEKNGFVVELDFFILEEVCRCMRRWIDDGKKPVVISVNQSRLHLNYDDYIWRLREIVDKYDIPYEYIELELTESVFTENAEKLLKIMHKLHEIGFKLSLDDFGSGYSSLNMLKDMPVDVVKIDKEFFSDTMNTQKGRAVISTVVDLANNLDMDVISEGVETREQVEFLTEIHCAMVQGYYFAKPMPIADFEKLWYSDLEDIRRKKERAAAQQQARLDAHSAEHSGNAADKADSEQTEQGGQDAPAEAEDTSAEAKETEKNDGSEEPAVTTE